MSLDNSEVTRQKARFERRLTACTEQARAARGAASVDELDDLFGRCSPTPDERVAWDRELASLDFARASSRCRHTLDVPLYRLRAGRTPRRAVARIVSVDSGDEPPPGDPDPDAIERARAYARQLVEALENAVVVIDGQVVRS